MGRMASVETCVTTVQVIRRIWKGASVLVLGVRKTHSQTWVSMFGPKVNVRVLLL